MDDKKEILKYPPKNSYSLEGMEFLRLHDHGQALIVRSKYSGVFDEHNYDFLIDSYFKEEFANFQLTDFMFARAKGFHGPFSINKLNIPSKPLKAIDTSSIRCAINSESVLEVKA